MTDMDLYIEPHLRWRLLQSGDAEALAALRTQLEALDNSVLTRLGAEFTGQDTHVPAALAVGGWDPYDSLSAYGLAYQPDESVLKLHLLGGVHPVHRHMSVGSSLLRWQVERSIAWRDEVHPGQDLTLCCHAETGRPGLERAALAIGFTLERYYYDLHRDLGSPIPERTVDGVRVVSFPPERSDDVRRVHNRSFANLGSAEVSPEQWGARIEDPAFRPEWSSIALVGERIVGYALCVEEGEAGQRVGWTERFGVDPDHRRRDIALALLSRSLRAMRADGCVEAGIGIDTPDGLGLARIGEDLGYTTRDAVALLTRVVPADR